MIKTSSILAGLFMVFLFGCKKELKETITGAQLPNETPSSQSFRTDSASHVPNELLVRFKKGTVPAGRVKALERIAGKLKEHVLTNSMRHIGDNEGFHVISTPLNALEAINKIRGAEIENVELNFIYDHYATSNDPYFTNGSLWGMYGDKSPLKTNSFGSQAAEAWDAGHTGSNTVYIGVIDEGAMHTHRDLAANFDTRYGWDFANNDGSTYDGASDDHGTHVAGTIGAKGGNGEGVAGVCWDVKMITAKFLGPRGGTTANAIKAVDYFTNLKKNEGVNIVATNNSWGGGGYSKELENAITRAGEAGILFICAAGNDGRNIDKTGSHSFPACYYNWNLIAVAAITSSGSLASYSNYGEVGRSDWPEGDPRRGTGTHSFLDIGAPGSGIYSTIPSKNGAGSSYASYNGTSMATPHVTGAAALYAAANATALDGLKSVQKAERIKNAILNAAASTSSLINKCITGGRLDANVTLTK